MTFARPTLTRTAPGAPNRARYDKFGGLPEGYPAVLWPICAQCAKPQTHIATLHHAAGRLDLGAPGRAVFVFQCNHNPGTCETWRADSGANACVILDATQRVDGAMGPPPGTATPVSAEAWVVFWDIAREVISPDQMPLMFSNDGMTQIPEEDLARIDSSTKLGGAPFWVQGWEDGPKPPFQFVGQIDGLLRVGDDHVAGANFGDGGLAYIFINTQAPKPEALMFWQRS